MAKKATTPIDLPSRRTVEQLFRSLLGWNSELQNASKAYAAYKAADKATEEFKEKLLDNPTLKKLEAKEKRLMWKWHDIERKFKKRAVELKMLYQARGLTREVKDEINNLVEDIRKCR